MGGCEHAAPHRIGQWAKARSGTRTSPSLMASPTTGDNGFMMTHTRSGAGRHGRKKTYGTYKMESAAQDDTRNESTCGCCPTGGVHGTENIVAGTKTKLK